MPFTSKLRADYVELINQELDTIQIDSLEDFALVEQALQNIIQPAEGYSSPEKYREKMFFIKGYLQSPELYVTHEQNYDEYTQIIRDRITAKINESQLLSAEHREQLLQQGLQNRARKTPERNNVIANADKVSPLPEEPLATAVAAGVAAGVITLEQYLQIPSYERESMGPLFSTDGREAVAAGVITLKQYLQIPYHERDSQLGDLINRNQQRPTM